MTTSEHFSIIVTRDSKGFIRSMELIKGGHSFCYSCFQGTAPDCSPEPGSPEWTEYEASRKASFFKMVSEFC